MEKTQPAKLKNFALEIPAVSKHQQKRTVGGIEVEETNDEDRIFNQDASRKGKTTLIMSGFNDGLSDADFNLALRSYLLAKDNNLFNVKKMQEEFLLEIDKVNKEFCAIFTDQERQKLDDLQNVLKGKSQIPIASFKVSLETIKSKIAEFRFAFGQQKLKNNYRQAKSEVMLGAFWRAWENPAGPDFVQAFYQLNIAKEINSSEFEKMKEKFLQEAQKALQDKKPKNLKNFEQMVHLLTEKVKKI